MSKKSYRALAQFTLIILLLVQQVTAVPLPPIPRINITQPVLPIATPVVNHPNPPDVEWEKSIYDISKSFELCDIKQTGDGGYIAVGYAASSGVVSGVSGFRHMAYVMKTGYSGVKEWEKYLGNQSYATCVQQTSDGGYILTGAYTPNDSTDKQGLQ